MPQPFDSGSATNPPKTIEVPADAKPKAPEGFEVTVFTEGDYTHPRLMIEGPNGDLFLVETKADKVHLLRDKNKDGKIDNATERFVFAEGLVKPFGMAIKNGYFYIGNTNSVVRAKYQPGQMKLEATEKIIDLPGGPDAKGHSTRNPKAMWMSKPIRVALPSVNTIPMERDIVSMLPAFAIRWDSPSIPSPNKSGRV